MNYCEKCMQPLEPGTVCERCGKLPPAPAHHLRPGTILQQKYYIGRAIGQGGFGITYIGRDLVLDTTVAIKEYYPSGEVNRDHNRSNLVLPNGNIPPEEYGKALERFLMEARILAKFSTEPGVVGVRDFFRENDTAYIVMEYLEGITLKEYLRIKGPVPANVLLRLMEPVLQVLHKIHARGLIHRDISPDNLMLMKDGRLKLLDFGAARAFADEKSLSIVLKQGYAPVEQYWNGDRQGAWTDVYAVCATIYKCLTGVTPIAAVQRAVQDELKPPSALGIAISPHQERALMKGLAVSDADRFRSIEELIAGFASTGTPAPAVPITVPVRENKESYASKAVAARSEREYVPTQSEKKTNLPLIIALIAVVVTALALGLWMLLGRDDGTASSDDDSQIRQEEPQTDPNDTSENDPEEPVVVSVRNVSVTEQIDTLELRFETDDVPEYWIVSYAKEGEEPKQEQFTGTLVTIKGLKPDTRYELELLTSEDATLEEPVVLIGRTKPGVTIVEDSVQVDFHDDEAKITWRSEGTQPNQWQITVTGDKGYREELTAYESECKIENLIYGETYKVEITCDHMAEPFTKEFRAENLYIDEITAEIADDGAVEVRWQCLGTEDVTWYVVCTPDDAPQQAWTQETKEQNLRLTDLQPGKTYTIELRTKDGKLLDGESAVSVDVPNSGSFSDYGFTGATATFYLRPEGRRWDIEDLEETRSSFAADEQIVFACRPDTVPQSSRDTVTVTWMVKDASGNTVEFLNVEEDWNDLWQDGVYVQELKNTPATPGTYTLELYFNTQKVELTENRFTVEE